MQLTPDHIFAGRYRLITKIGMGGFSEVWKVADEMAEDRLMALKIYAPERGLDEHGIKQFRREYAITLDLNHPNLLKAHHFDVSGGSPYLLMPLCEGGSLYAKLAEHGPLTEKQLAEMLVQVASALEYLHRKDVTHQDIKPDNVLIDGDGNYMLMDFGISSRLRSTMQKSTTTAKAMTVAYAPPEKFEGMAKVGPEGDVFSLGVMLVELLTGDLPWSGMGGAYVRPDSKPIQLPGSVSPALTALIQRCTAHDPAQRPLPKELKEAAERYLGTGNWDVATQSSGRKTEVVTPKLEIQIKSSLETQSQPKQTSKPEQRIKPEMEQGKGVDDGNRKNAIKWLARGVLALVLIYVIIAWPSKEEATEDEPVVVNVPIDTAFSPPLPFDTNNAINSQTIIPIDTSSFTQEPAEIKKNDWKNLEVFKSKSGKYGFRYKKSKEIVLPAKYDNAYPFSEGVAVIKYGNKYAYINVDGILLTPFKYDDAWPLENGFAAVKSNNKWGYIDGSGRQIAKCIYDYVHTYFNGFARVANNNRYGFIDAYGIEIIPLKYDYVYDFSEGLAAVKLSGYHGYVNQRGDLVVSIKYDATREFSEGRAAVMLNNLWGYIDKTGKTIIPFKYNDAGQFYGGTANVELNGKTFYINKQGECVKDCP